MNQALFWLKMAPNLPHLLKAAKKARELPFDERYAYAREELEVVIRKLNLEVHVFGTENLRDDRAMLLTGNHQGTLDAFVYLYANPIPTTSVSKIEGKKIPVLSDWYDALEFIYFDRSNLRDAVRMVKEVTEQLKNGRNVTVFPEGTRSKSQHMTEFKPGAFKAAFQAKAAIQPFALVNAYIPLDSNEETKPIYCIFLKPLEYEEYCDLSTTEVAEIVQNRIREAIRQYA